MSNKIVLKKLRVVVLRLSEERIEESRRKSYGRAYTDTEDLEAKSSNDEQRNTLLPKTIGRLHYCPESGCKHSSVYRWQVIEHIRIHTGEKPYICNVTDCDSAFAQKSQLTRHSNSHKMKPFKCRICSRPRRFHTQEDLDFHVNVRHLNLKKQFKCKLCGNAYSNTTSLKAHLTLTHAQEKNVVCRICWESFNWSYQLKNHEETVHFGKERQKDFKCSICKCSYLNKSSLITHKVQKHGGNPKKFDCTFCDKSFQASNELTAHVRTHTGEKPFGCKFCPFKTSQNSNLKTHIKRIHTKDKSYKCEICSKAFVNRSELEFHSRVHTGEKLHTCSTCEKTFAYKSALKSHMRTHTGEKPYTCTFCHKNFRHSTTLRLHTQTHTKETIKNIKCNECESKFRTFQDLKNHMMIHTGEKPFTCKLCTKTFRLKSNFRDHGTSHTESFDCDECEKKYSYKSHLVAHIKRTHIRDKIFECTFCGKTFYDNSNLTRHIVTHTKEKSYKCTKCGKTYGSSSELCRHRQKCNKVRRK